MSLYSDIYEFMILQGTELHQGNQWYFVIWQQDLDLCFSVTDGLWAWCHWPCIYG